MDPSVLIQRLLILWFLIPLVAILCSPWFKGSLGEFLANASTSLFPGRKLSAEVRRCSRCFVIAITKTSNDYRACKAFFLDKVLIVNEGKS
jgi:hypothetical protein